MQQYFRIIGTGGCLPELSITAEDLDARLGLAAGWTRRHTGVAVRHQRAPDENATQLGARAARQALAAAGCGLRDVDVIIDASTCQQQPIPCNAVLLQGELGPDAAGIPAFDVHGTCLSFLLALSSINGFFAAGQYRRALIVSAETPLDGVNWSDPASACLFGDGAAAVVVERADPPVGPFAFVYETFAEHATVCEVRAGTHRIPPDTWSRERDALFRFAMNGPRLHRLASRHLPPLVERAMRAAGRDLAGLHVVPHQASGPAVALMCRRLGLAPAQMQVSLPQHGNLVAAGIPYALHHAGARIPVGAPLMLLGTAAGYAQGVMILTR